MISGPYFDISDLVKQQQQQQQQQQVALSGSTIKVFSGFEHAGDNSKQRRPMRGSRKFVRKGPALTICF